MLPADRSRVPKTDIDSCVVGVLVCAGTTELASVGVSLSIYSTITRLLNSPLLSVTTTAVASALGRSDGAQPARTHHN